MAKFGIGVGEEFPVDEPNNPPPPENDDERRKMRRHWRRHHLLHLLTRIALLALIVSAIAWLFRPHYFYAGGPYAPYAFYPYPHHFFFPVFPVLLIAFLLAFAWRRGACYGMHHHWHDHPRDDRREGA